MKKKNSQFIHDALDLISQGKDFKPLFPEYDIDEEAVPAVTGLLDATRELAAVKNEADRDAIYSFVETIFYKSERALGQMYQFDVRALKAAADFFYAAKFQPAADGDFFKNAAFTIRRESWEGVAEMLDGHALNRLRGNPLVTSALLSSSLECLERGTASWAEITGFLNEFHETKHPHANRDVVATVVALTAGSKNYRSTTFHAAVKLLNDFAGEDVTSKDLIELLDPKINRSTMTSTLNQIEWARWSFEKKITTAEKVGFIPNLSSPDSMKEFARRVKQMTFEEHRKLNASFALSEENAAGLLSSTSFSWREKTDGTLFVKKAKYMAGVLASAEEGDFKEGLSAKEGLGKVFAMHSDGRLERFPKGNAGSDLAK